MFSFADSLGRPRASTADTARWYYQGRGALAHEDWDAAQAAFAHAAAQLREGAEWSLLWLCHIGLATLAWRAEDGAAALEHAREAHVLADRLGGTWPRLWGLWLLGHLYAGHAMLAEAAACFGAVEELLSAGGDDDEQTLRHLAAVAAMQCRADGAAPELLAERLFALAHLSLRIGKRQGLPLEALEGLAAAPRLLRESARGDALGRGPIEWLRSLLPAPEAARPPAQLAPRAPAQGAAEPSAGAAQPDLRAYLFGRFELWVGHSLVTQWAGSKSKTLLKLLLAAHPAPLPAASLMATLWDGVDEELARQRLHTAISDLRRALRAVRPEAGALIVSQSGGYGLDPRATVWIDTAAFSRAQRAGLHYEQAGRPDEARAALQEAVALYRGEYLEEDVYDDWPIEQRERLKSEYLALLARLAHWAFREGDYEACIGWGQLTIECDPCREDTHSLLMRCHSRLGQRAMALRQYRQCADALRRELDAIPAPETDELYRRLQQGQEL